MAEFAVIGMGQFGRAVARSLTLEKQFVLAIDVARERLDLVRDLVEAVVLADTTDEEAIQSLGLDRMTCVVVAMGPRALEASVLTTAILNDLEVPRIVARAFDSRHARLLLALGAHETVNPEEELGRQVAERLTRPTVMGRLELGDAEIAEIEAPEAFVGRSLEELDLRNRLGVTLLAIHREDSLQVNPQSADQVQSGDVLVLLGTAEAIAQVTAEP